MTAIGPGDLVECIESWTFGACSVERGAIYVCTEVRHTGLGLCGHGPDCHNAGLRLRESPTPSWGYWCAASFRPVGTPAASLIAQFTTGAPPERVAA